MPDVPAARHSEEAAFAHLLADAFHRAGWKAVREPVRPGGYRPDLILIKGRRVFAVELKVASEARRDRLIPLLAQAILEARAGARAKQPPAVPLAVVAARHVPNSLAAHIRRFAADFAPEVAVGVMDGEGYREFTGPGLEVLNAPRARADRKALLASPEPSAHLFSDLNQWMLKVLLAPRIPERFLAAPRSEYRNASELAKAANVSVMSAFRFLRQLKHEGFLHEGHDPIRLVRLEALMRRWQAANLRPGREFPMRWILREDAHQLHEALRSYAQRGQAEPGARGRSSRAASAPRICLGLFAAADALGVGLVHGAPPYVYLEQVDAHVVRQLGLSRADSGGRVDVYLRVPAARESVFRAAVRADGVPVSDVVQVWLDAGVHPARGREQAEEIRRRVLRPLFAEKQQ
jgi:hypothetical protein